MKEVLLSPKSLPKVGIEAWSITPDAFSHKKITEIENLPVQFGKHIRKLGHFFDISGSRVSHPSNLRIVIEGDVSKVKRMGHKMSNGEILIRGNAGMYLGEGMSGGRIIVKESALHFIGQQMIGGELIIEGNVGNCLGSSYRGDPVGMAGGKIVVHGNVGSEIGDRMVNGTILVKGECGDFAGVHMRGGLLVIEGQSGRRVGAQMTGGNIILLKPPREILPSFRPRDEEKNLVIDDYTFFGDFLSFTGDHSQKNARGKILIKRRE